MDRDTIVLLGVNHKTTPLAIREKLAISGGYEEPLMQLGSLEEIKEYYLLSTCNRVEILFTCTEPEKAAQSVLNLLFSDSVTADELKQYIYHYRDDEAVEHLFLVASSLDSMIVGETQILGQLKEAYRHASTHKSSGYILNKLLHKSFSVAKRVRTETGIGASAVSISYAAVELGKKIFGNLLEKKVLLIGAGEMAELAAEHLVGQGVAEVIVANRTLKRAVTLARCFNGHAIALEELLDQLEHVDIVISSTGSSDLILHRDQVKKVMRERRNRPLFFIDIAVPRDLDAKINELENVYLYDIDDLNNVVEMNKNERDKEAVRAERIIAEEKIKFSRWLENLVTTPTIIQFRTMVEGVVQEELERTAGRLKGMRPEEREAIEEMVSSIGRKLMHYPLQYLKKEDQREGHGDRISNMRAIFSLDSRQDDN